MLITSAIIDAEELMELEWDFDKLEHELKEGGVEGRIFFQTLLGNGEYSISFSFSFAISKIEGHDKLYTQYKPVDIFEKSLILAIYQKSHTVFTCDELIPSIRMGLMEAKPDSSEYYAFLYSLAMSLDWKARVFTELNITNIPNIKKRR